MLAIQWWATRLPTIAEITIVVLGAWMLAGWLQPSSVVKMGGIKPLLAGQEEVKLNMDVLLNTALFGKLQKHSVPVIRVKPVVISRLNIKLLGTVVAGDKSAAVILMQGKRNQQLFFIGDSIQPGVTLRQVDAEAIIMDHRGKLERIEITKEKALVTMSARSNLPRRDITNAKHQQVSRHMLNSELKNFSRLLSQARVTPHFDNGKPDGFLIRAIVAGSLYDRIGLKNGDIIRKVNGIEITGPQQAMVMMQKLQTAMSVDVEFKRQGNIQQMHYDVQ